MPPIGHSEVLLGWWMRPEQRTGRPNRPKPLTWKWGAGDLSLENKSERLPNETTGCHQEYTEATAPACRHEITHTRTVSA